MKKTRTISFAELRQFLQTLGYQEKSADNAIVFDRAHADLLVFRRYSDHESVDLRDLVSTRKFLDAWGLLEAADFNNFLARATTSA